MITSIQRQGPEASSGSASQTTAGAAATKEQFLKLLVTQLQHQDPLNPMDAKEFTAQLAQFSLLEQALRTNQQLETLNLYEASANNARAVGLIGKEVVALGDKVTIGEQGTGTMYFRLPTDSSKSQVHIFDASGRLVRTLEVGSLSAGDQYLTWDGKDQLGKALPAGAYNVQVVAKDVRGNEIQVEQYLRGRASSATFREGVTALSVNGIPVPLGKILEVHG